MKPLDRVAVERSGLLAGEAALGHAFMLAESGGFGLAAARGFRDHPPRCSTALRCFPLALNRIMPRPTVLFLTPLALWLGCAQFESPSPIDVAEPAVVRGQSPVGDGWGPSYLAPGEEYCGEPFEAYEGGYVAPGYVAPNYAAPGYAAPGYAMPPQAIAPQIADPQAGWLDVLPPDGGPISPDFGLPKSAEVSNRTPNPIFVRVSNQDAAWETIAATLNDYFKIDTEQRVTQTGAVLTEGRLETRWQSGATVFEPWRNDSVGAFNRWQSTLQTIRRRASVRVIPAAGGLEIGVRVDKQLEDLNRPEQASAGAASLRSDGSLPTDRLTPVDTVLGSERWINIGRDEPLEQEMLRRFQQRLTRG